MPAYTAPLRDMRFTLFELLRADEKLRDLPGHNEIDAALIDQTLEAAGRFAAERIAGLNAAGDAEGCSLTAEGVRTPRGFKAAYDDYAQAGWPSLACSAEHGGQGLPKILRTAVDEILAAANTGWAMGFAVVNGVYTILSRHAAPELQAIYLPKLVSGEWLASMCLTEPHCGTDLGLLRTRAEPESDGSYRINGSKIFITGGDQDWTPNIVHLVLARLPGAPSGNKGISLFLVPKYLSHGESLANARNGVSATGVEHKMGLRASATCAMSFENAKGWLVGEPNRGLSAMFLLMNDARLGVGVQSVGIAERGYQAAVAYARDRLQMRAGLPARRPDLPADPIILHADVRRMLLTQKAHIEGGRMLNFWLALCIDQEHAHPDPAMREQAGELLALLTPIAKAFLSDNSFMDTNLALQVHGGHGYLTDYGVEQLVRDVRVAQIYEGTNGIQARDLLSRKILNDGGARLHRLLGLARDFAGAQEATEMQLFTEPLLRLCERIEAVTARMARAASHDPEEAGAAGYDYLHALGHLVFAYLFARTAAAALPKQDGPDAFYASKLATARFYFTRILPEADGRLAMAEAGLASLSAIDEARLFA